jgi:hypothetical protein
MRNAWAVAAAALVLVAGCTSGSDESSDSGAALTTTATPATDEATEATTTAETTADTSDTGGTEPAAADTTVAPDAEEFVDQTLAGASPGITDDTIKIGITYIDLGSVETASVNHGDYEAAYRTRIDVINAAGGINGRMIEPVFAPISIADGGNADAVCVQLTEDEEVFVVMGFFMGDAPACYLELNEKAVLGGSVNDGLMGRAKAPWFSIEGSDAQTDAIAALAEADAFVEPFALYATIDNQGLIEDTILPALAAAGLEPVEIAYNDAPIGDTAATESQNAAILQRFESLGVASVVTAGNDGSSIAGALETSAYRPKILSTLTGTLQAFAAEAGRDLSVLDGAVAAGEYGPNAAIYSEPDMVGCIDDYTAAGNEFISPDDWTDGPRMWVSMGYACKIMTLFDELATYAGPNLNYATFQAAGDTIGDVKLPGLPEPYFFGPPPSRDGDAPVFVFEWNPASGQLEIR